MENNNILSLLFYFARLIIIIFSFIWVCTGFDRDFCVLVKVGFEPELIQII